MAEVLEWRFPVRLDEVAIRDGSGAGEGARRGGDGVIRNVRFLKTMSTGILSTGVGWHRSSDSRGTARLPGSVGRNSIQRADGTRVEPSRIANVQMAVDDVFVVETPGGGGFGRREIGHRPLRMELP